MHVVIVVFALIAAFVAWRLYTVLGTRTGTERPPMQPARVGGDVIDMRPNPPPPPAERWRGVAEPGSALARGLDAIAASDPGFDPAHFLTGAKAAYEMIITAFAAGNTEMLGGLLAPEPLANFTRAIETRRAAGQSMKVTLVSIDSAKIVEAEARNGAALIAVRYEAKMTSVTTDASGAVVEGSPTDVADHVEVWTFSRPLGSRNPNWRLESTSAAH